MRFFAKLVQAIGVLLLLAGTVFLGLWIFKVFDDQIGELPLPLAIVFESLLILGTLPYLAAGTALNRVCKLKKQLAQRPPAEPPVRYTPPYPQTGNPTQPAVSLPTDAPYSAPPDAPSSPPAPPVSPRTLPPTEATPAQSPSPIVRKPLLRRVSDAMGGFDATSDAGKSRLYLGAGALFALMAVEYLISVVTLLSHLTPLLIGNLLLSILLFAANGAAAVILLMHRRNHLPIVGFGLLTAFTLLSFLAGFFTNAYSIFSYRSETYTFSFFAMLPSLLVLLGSASLTALSAVSLSGKRAAYRAQTERLWSLPAVCVLLALVLSLVNMQETSGILWSTIQAVAFLCAGAWLVFPNGVTKKEKEESTGKAMGKLYANIGSKLKYLAMAIGCLGLLAIVVGLVVELVTVFDEFEGMFLLIAAASGLVCFFTSWPLYGFGQMVSDIHEMRGNSEK